MKMKFNILPIAITAVLGAGMSSCNDWLRVDMEDKVMEKTMFSDYKGYCTALNGIYIGMNGLYSNQLSTGAIDVMAQYYNVTENNSHSKRLYAGYKYNDPSIKTSIENIWQTLYNLIANTNVVIEHTETGDVLNEKQRGIIRGEAFALRAFLHFDLLRLFGPIYSTSPDQVCIPYQESSQRVIQPLLPASEVLGKIINDLKEAESLLSQYDPIITEGVGNILTNDDGVSTYDTSFRQLRLNYYAVEAMLARAYLWKGDKTEAYKYAKTNVIDKVTTEDLEVFPWVTLSQIDAEGKNDYLFSSEVIFSLYNSKRVDNVLRANFISTLTLANRLTFVGSSLSSNSKVATFYDDLGDYRRKMWSTIDPTDEEIEAAGPWGEALPTLVFNKYDEFTKDAINNSTGTVTTYRFMVPLIRLSEMYLIAAESSPNTTEALELINTLRLHRNCRDLPADTDIDRAITYEMAREVIGGGQLFYFYKRRAMTEIISGTSIDGKYNMQLSNYTLPLPDSEIEERNISNL